LPDELLLASLKYADQGFCSVPNVRPIVIRPYSDDIIARKANLLAVSQLVIL
jgi:hypothetical protein